MADQKFATSVTCMDGRIQIPLANWIKEQFSVDFVDAITEPGIDKIIAEDSSIDSIKNKINISINAHKSKLIVISGHHDCAGNPVSRDQHVTQIKKSVKIIASQNPNIKVIGVWGR